MRECQKGLGCHNEVNIGYTSVGFDRKCTFGGLNHKLFRAGLLCIRWCARCSTAIVGLRVTLKMMDAKHILDSEVKALQTFLEQFFGDVRICHQAVVFFGSISVSVCR